MHQTIGLTGYMDGTLNPSPFVLNKIVRRLTNKSEQVIIIIISMAARQLAGRRPLYFTADVSILFIFFFAG